jgi:hypothetical protein
MQTPDSSCGDLRTPVGGYGNTLLQNDDERSKALADDDE